MFRVITDEPLSISGKTLLLPAVSVGNSGTLALDLLLNNSPYRKLGWIYSSDFLPIVGLDALDNAQNSLALPLELYEGDGIVILQIRSLCVDIKGFIEKLVKWAAENGISSIIVAGSNWDEMKANENEPDPFYLNNSLVELCLEISKKEFSEYKEFLSEAGLIKQLMTQKDINATAIMVYGKDVAADVPSAFRLAETLLSVFKISKTITPPKSWRGILN